MNLFSLNGLPRQHLSCYYSGFTSLLRDSEHYQKLAPLGINRTLLCFSNLTPGLQQGSICLSSDERRDILKNFSPVNYLYTLPFLDELNVILVSCAMCFVIILTGK